MGTSYPNRRCRLRPDNGSRQPASRKETMRALCSASLLLGYILAAATSAHAQTALTWEQVKARFESANPSLKADAINVDEMKAEEVTAFLRPNPQFTLSSDGTQLVPHSGVWQPTQGTQMQTNFSYLHERERKRELR